MLSCHFVAHAFFLSNLKSASVAREKSCPRVREARSTFILNANTPVTSAVHKGCFRFLFSRIQTEFSEANLTMGTTSEPSAYDAGSIAGNGTSAPLQPLDLRDLDQDTVRQLARMHGFKVRKKLLKPLLIKNRRRSAARACQQPPPYGWFASESFSAWLYGLFYLGFLLVSARNVPSKVSHNLQLGETIESTVSPISSKVRFYIQFKNNSF